MKSEEIKARYMSSESIKLAEYLFDKYEWDAEMILAVLGSAIVIVTQFAFNEEDE